MEQYISKSALIAEINRLIAELVEEGEDTMFEQGRISAFEDTKLFLDTLKVKEVDYEHELSKYVSDGIHCFFPNVDDDYCKMDSVIWQNYVIDTAKHFFELGLKAQKGE